MTINSVKMRACHHVVEEGVKSALLCGALHMKALETHDKLTDELLAGYTPEQITPEMQTLVDLLNTAVMMVALERCERRLDQHFHQWDKEFPAQP